jgi:hypothetical protein
LAVLEREKKDLIDHVELLKFALSTNRNELALFRKRKIIRVADKISNKLATFPLVRRILIQLIEFPWGVGERITKWFAHLRHR